MNFKFNPVKLFRSLCLKSQKTSFRAVTLILHSFFLVALLDLSLTVRTAGFLLVLIQTIFLRSLWLFWINLLVSLCATSVILRVLTILVPTAKIPYEIVAVLVGTISVLITVATRWKLRLQSSNFVGQHGLTEVVLLVVTFASLKISIGDPSGIELATLLVAEDNAVWNSTASRSLAQTLTLQSLSNIGYSPIQGPLTLTLLGVTAPIKNAGDPNFVDLVLRTTMNLWTVLIFGLTLFVGFLSQSLINVRSSFLTHLLIVSAIGGALPILLFGLFFRWGSLTLLVSLLFLISSFVLVSLDEAGSYHKNINFVFVLSLLLGAALSWWPMFMLASSIVAVFLLAHKRFRVYWKQLMVMVPISMVLLLLLRAGSPMHLVSTAKESFVMLSPQNTSDIFLGILLVFTSLFLIRRNFSSYENRRFVLFYLTSIFLAAFIWVVQDLISRLLVGQSSYGSNKIFQVVMVSSFPMMILLFSEIGKRLRIFEKLICALLIIGIVTKSSLVIDLVVSGQNILSMEKLTVEQKSMQLFYEAQKATPSAQILCHSGLGLDYPSNYLNERAAYICSRHSSGFARTVNPYLISTWAIAQTQRVSPSNHHSSALSGDIFLELLKQENEKENLTILNLTPTDDQFLIDSWPGIAWLEDLDLNRFSIERTEFTENVSLATWLLKNE